MQVPFALAMTFALCAGNALAQCETVSFQAPGNELDFGQSVAMLDHVAAVGSPSSGPSQSGVVHVYAKDANTAAATWALSATLTATDGQPGAGFGRAVSMWSRCIAVGTDAQSVYVFEDQAGTWVQTHKLTPTVPASDEFGVAIQMHKSKLIVGAPDSSGTTPGSAHLFELQGSSWVPTVVFQPFDGQPGDDFGRSVATYRRILIGAPGRDTSGPQSGAAYLYENTEAGWTELEPFAATDGAPQERFGYSVSILDNSALIGAPSPLPAGSGNGAAYLYRRDEIGNFALEQKLQGSDDTTGSLFATKVYVTERAAVVSAPLAQSANGTTGAAYLWDHSLSGWSEIAKLVASDATDGALFSASAALWNDWLILGAPAGGSLGTGSSNTFFVGLPAKPYCQAKTSSQGCTPQIGSVGTPSFSDPSAFEITATNVLNYKSGLLFYGLGASAAIPFFGGTLCILPPLQRTGIQNSGGNLPPDDCSGSYSFDFNAHAQSGIDPFLMPGQHVFAQYWSRDPQHADGTGVGLTDAIEIMTCP